MMWNILFRRETVELDCFKITKARKHTPLIQKKIKKMFQKLPKFSKRLDIF